MYNNVWTVADESIWTGCTEVYPLNTKCEEANGLVRKCNIHTVKVSSLGSVCGSSLYICLLH